MKRTALVVPAVLLAAWGCGVPEETPLYEVRAQTFVHRVDAEGTLRSVQSANVSVPVVVNSRVRLVWIAPEGSMVTEGDVIARFDHTEFERRLEDARADLWTASLGSTEAEAESERKLAEYQRDLEVADLELDLAQSYQKSDGQIYSQHEIAESEIDEKLAGARRDHAERMSATQGGLGRTELDLLAIESRKANLRIDEARAGLESLEVKAPRSGVLTLMRNWRGEPPTVGSEMWAGQEIAEIPVLDQMEAEVFVLEADAGGLREGKPARVTVESHREVVNRGSIARVDAIAKPRFRGSPVQYFSVTVALDQTDRGTMKPGQRVSASLFLEELPDVLAVPRQALFTDGERTWVHVRDGSGFTVRDVQTGAASAGLVVITAGLEEGESIALIAPRGPAAARGEAT